MHRRMLRDPRVRGARGRAVPRRRGARASCTCRSGRRRRRSARAGRCGPTDVITSTHRGHGHCLAKGLDPLGMFAELMAQGRRARTAAAAARCTSPTRRIGIFGANGIVGAGLPIAVGAATAAQLRADGSVAVAFFGDGAVAQGAFHEAVNLAAVWQLPVIFFCENNGYAEFSPAVDAARGAARAAGRRLRRRLRRGRRQRRRGDRGRDERRRRRRPRRPRSRRRRGRRPTAGTATTRATRSATASADEVREWEARDPLARARARGSASAGVADDDDRGARSRRSTHELDDAVEAARGVAGARRSRRCTDFVVRAATGAARTAGRRPPTRRCSAPWTRSATALEAELAADERVFVAGIDVGAGGNVFGLTRGLHDRFGDRVRDTPISETRDHRPRRRRGDGRACARWSS